MIPVQPLAGIAFRVHDLPKHHQLSIEINAETGCWEWTRSRSRDGYGWTSLHNKTHQAHRLIYTLLCGPVSKGMVLDHLCRVRHCVNPEHLEPVTPGENIRRSELTPAGAKRCMRCGGDFIRIRGQRRCPKCLAAYEDSRRVNKKLSATDPPASIGKDQR